MFVLDQKLSFFTLNPTDGQSFILFLRNVNNCFTFRLSKTIITIHYTSQHDSYSLGKFLKFTNF